MKNTLLLLIAFILFLGCSEESERLVNPPAINNTINIRFINLGGTTDSRTMELLNNTKLENIPYNTSTASINPPADSTTFKVFQGSNLEYEYNRVYRFRIRNTNYSFFTLPTRDNGPNYQNVDTLLNFRTALTVPQNTSLCLVRLFNAFPDSASSYSLRLGCPNGQVLSSGMSYKRINSQATSVKSGTVAFSIVKTKNGENEILDLYRAELEPQGQYTFVVAKGADGNEEVMLLDENNLDADAYRPAEIIDVQLAHMRTINLSGSPVDINKIEGDAIANAVSDDHVDIYQDIITCASEELDTLLVNNAVGMDTISASLEVLQDYSVAAFKSTNGIKSVLIEPVPNELEAENKATIRVVHGAESIEGITVSVGARNQPLSSDNESNFVIGELITTQLNYGEVSSHTYFEPSVDGQSFQLPLTILTSTEPADLLYTTLADVEPNREYLLIISEDDQGNVQSHLVESNEQDIQPLNLEEGVMLQVLHAVPGLDQLEVTVDQNYLLNANVFFSGTVTTVIPSGDQSVMINGINHTITADPEKRPYIIAAGNSGNIQIFDLNQEPMGAQYGEFKRRFVNASEDIQRLGIKEEEADTIPIQIFVDYQQSTDVETINLNNKQAFFFYDFNSGEEIFRVGDISPSYAKNYYYVFAGKRDVGDGFTMIIMQEF